VLGDWSPGRRLSTPENRDRFQKHLTTFAPQIGGYSVFGVARGKRYYVFPKSWDIIDGKLYLSQNKKPRTLLKYPAGYLNSVESNWREIPARRANPKDIPPRHRDHGPLAPGMIWFASSINA
jgi:hypothetical protein